MTAAPLRLIQDDMTAAHCAECGEKVERIRRLVATIESLAEEKRINDETVKKYFRQVESLKGQLVRQQHMRRQDDTFQAVFKFWQLMTVHPRAKPTDDRAQAVHARIADGYTPKDFFKAVVGAAHDPFSKDGKIFNDLELICRKGTKFEANREKYYDVPDVRRFIEACGEGAMEAATALMDLERAASRTDGRSIDRKEPSKEAQESCDMTPSTATRMNVRRLEKHCPGCNQTLPRESFALKSKVKGDTRWAVCDDCLPEYRAQRQGRARATERERDRKRRSAVPADRERVPQLSTEPIRRWLIEELGLPTVEESPFLSPEEKGQVRQVAQWLNVNDRQIHRWRSGEADRTSLDLLDAAFCHAGIPWKLREMFPALYEPSRTWMYAHPASCLECHGPCLGYDPSVFDYEDAEEQMAS